MVQGLELEKGRLLPSLRKQGYFVNCRLTEGCIPKTGSSMNPKTNNAMPSKEAVTSVSGVDTYGEEPEVGFWEYPWGILLIMLIGVGKPILLVGKTILWAGDPGLYKLEKGPEH